jgi:hypothetical protein
MNPWLRGRRIAGITLALAVALQLPVLVPVCTNLIFAGQDERPANLGLVIGTLSLILSPYGLALLVFLCSRTPAISLAITIPWALVHGWALYTDYRSEGGDVVSNYGFSFVFGIPLSLFAVAAAVLLRTIIEQVRHDA